MCLRGFLDLQAAILAVAAATASLLSHRLVMGTAVSQRWKICSFDIGSAAMQGITFPEASHAPGEVKREVYYYLPSAEDYQILYEIDAEYYSALV